MRRRALFRAPFAALLQYRPVAEPTATTTATGIVRATIDLRQFPGASPFLRAYPRAYDSVSPLFAGNPADPSAWRGAIRRAHAAPHERATVASVIKAQLER